MQTTLGATVFFLLGFAAYRMHVDERRKEHPYKGNRPEIDSRINKNNASLVATLILATASFLSKETGITLLPVCLFYDLIRTMDQGSRKKSGSNCLSKVI